MSERRCDGDGYLERFNDDQTDIIIELCSGCADCDSCIAEEEDEDK